MWILKWQTNKVYRMRLRYIQTHMHRSTDWLKWISPNFISWCNVLLSVSGITLVLLSLPLSLSRSFSFRFFVRLNIIYLYKIANYTFVRISYLQWQTHSHTNTTIWYAGYATKLFCNQSSERVFFDEIRCKHNFCLHSFPWYNWCLFLEHTYCTHRWLQLLINCLTECDELFRNKTNFNILFSAILELIFRKIMDMSQVNTFYLQLRQILIENPSKKKPQKSTLLSQSYDWETKTYTFFASSYTRGHL